MNDLSRLLKFAYSLMKMGENSRFFNSSKLIIEKDSSLESGGNYDLYLPSTTCSTIAVALHGVTIDGKNDARLIQFAKTLASSGVACAVPHLANLARGRFHSDDLKLVCELINQLQRHQKKEAGLIGFSYGGSYALTVAAKKELAQKLSFVVSFGASYSIAESLAKYASTDYKPVSDLEWDNFIHLALIGACQFREALELSDSAVAESERLLRHYCTLENIARKRDFYQQNLASYELVSRFITSILTEDLESLSPVGKLANVDCNVSLIHGADDHMIAPDDSRRIFSELTRAGNGSNTRLLITRLLSHVNPGEITFFESLQFLKSIKQIFENPEKHETA
ncbi:MAG: hypothetical protein ACOYXC_09760 [Candidatus Rifleibacteriota bacterium]